MVQRETSGGERCAARFRAVRAGLLLLLVGVALLCGGTSAAEEAGGEKASAHNTADTVADLERLARTGKLSFEELRSVNKSLEALRAMMRQKSRSEAEADYLEYLRKLMLEKADAANADRVALLDTAQFLLYAGDAPLALKYLMRTRPASVDDIEWPLIATRAYLLLGDYAKAALYSERVDSLLQRRSPLILSQPVAVAQVTGYRLYQTSPSVEFKPGDMLTLYIEINGAKFSTAGVGSARCSIYFSLELRDDLQNILENNDDYGRYDPVYAGPVRDLHATIYYRLPDSLVPGKYALIVRCRDELNNNITAQTDYPFTVGGQVKPAATEADRKAVEKAQATAARMQQKAASKGATGMLDELSPMDDLDVDDLDALGKKSKDGTLTPAQEQKKKVADLMLENSKRSGDLLNK